MRAPRPTAAEIRNLRATHELLKVVHARSEAQLLKAQRLLLCAIATLSNGDADQEDKLETAIASFLLGLLPPEHETL